MVILLGDDGAELCVCLCVCVCVQEMLLPHMAVITVGCMTRTKEERVNVMLSMRLSLIDGQLKSWFPFTVLSAESCASLNSLLKAVIAGDKRVLVCLFFPPSWPQNS